jgi:hypothetical protein
MSNTEFDDMIIAFAKTIKEYTDIHTRCWNSTPEECKEMMTMQFPYLQGTEIHSLLNKIAAKDYDKNKAGLQMRDYLTK